MSHPSNPFLNLNYEPAIESLADYHDSVTAAEYPLHQLRWRNDDILPTLGLDSSQVNDDDFIEAFGHFRAVRPIQRRRSNVPKRICDREKRTITADRVGEGSSPR